MNTEFVSVSPDLTVVDTIKLLRETANEAETIYYIYVTDMKINCGGLFAAPTGAISARIQSEDFMEDRVITVDLLDTQE